MTTETDTGTAKPTGEAEETRAPGTDPSTEDGHRQPEREDATGTQAQEDEEAAYGEGFDADDEPGDPGPIDGDDDPPPEPGQGAEATAEGDDEPPPATPEPSDTGEEGTDPPREPSTPPAGDPENLKQETRTWQGRAKKAREEAEAEERRLAELRAQREALGRGEDPERATEAEGERRQAGEAAAAAQAAGKVLSDEEQEALEALRQDYPSLYKGILAANRVAQAEFEQQHVAPLRQEVQSRSREEHYAAIAAEHSDWRDVVGSDEFVGWLEEVPHRDHVRYQQVMQGGSAEEVNAMLAAFKEATGHGQRRPPSNDEPGTDTPPPPNGGTRSSTSPRRSSAAGVRPHSARPGTGKRGGDKDDYDAGFNMDD